MTLPDIVDVHAHALTEGFIDAYRRLDPVAGPTLAYNADEVSLTTPTGPTRGPFPRSFVDPAAREHALARDGVATHVLSSPPFMFLYDRDAGMAAELIAVLNDSLVAWASAMPGRFRVLASLPLQDVGRSVSEVNRLANQQAVAGVAIGSSVGRVELDDRSLEPLWETLTSADLPVLIHPVDPPGARLSRYFMRNTIGNPIETTIAAACLIFGGVLDRHPALRVCLVHGGGFVPYQLGRLEHGFAHRAETRSSAARPPREYLGQLFFDTILHDRAAIQFMAGKVGWEQVVVGTDYPFEMGDLALRDTLEALALNPAELAGVCSGNADRFLRTLA